MAIEFACPECQHRLTAPDSAGGKKAKCPSCGAVASIPIAPKPVAAEPKALNELVSPKPPKAAPQGPRLLDLSELIEDADSSGIGKGKEAVAPRPVRPAPPVSQDDEFDLVPDSPPEPRRPQRKVAEFTEQPKIEPRGEPKKANVLPSWVTSVDSASQTKPQSRAASMPPPISTMPPQPFGEGLESLGEPVPFVPAAPTAAPAGAMPRPTSYAPPRAVRSPGGGSLFGDCFDAIGYGFKNLGSALTLIILMAVFGVVLQLAINLFGSALAAISPWLGLLAMFAWFFVNMAVSGWMVQFQADIISTSIEGEKEPPPVPQWDWGGQFKISGRALGLACVYVLPIVTLPLMPLGLLAMGRTGDGRAFNLLWAVRSALQRPGQLVLMWVVMLFWMGMAIVGSVIIALLCGGLLVLSTGVAMKIVAAIVMVLLWYTLAVLSGCISCRCIGRMGYRCPEIVQSIATEPTPGVSLVYVLAGLLLSVGVYGAIGSSMGLSSIAPKSWSRTSGGDGSGGSRGGLSGLVGSSDKSKSDAAQEGLWRVGRAYAEFSVKHDQARPTSLDDLVKEGLLGPSQVCSPNDPAQKYVYENLPSDAAWDSILAYDPVPIDSERVAVLRFDFTIHVATTSDLEASLKKQRGRAAKPDTHVVRKNLELNVWPDRCQLKVGGIAKDVPPISQEKRTQYEQMERAMADLFPLVRDYCATHQGHYPKTLDELAESAHRTVQQLALPGQTEPTMFAAIGSMPGPDTEIVMYNPTVVYDQLVLAVNRRGDVLYEWNDRLALRLDSESSYRTKVADGRAVPPTPRPSPGVGPTPAPTPTPRVGPTPEPTPTPRVWPTPEPTPTPQPVSNVVVVAGKKLTVEWDVTGWNKEPNLATGHKFPKICQVIREVTKDRDTARVGVTYGPEAKTKDDASYAEFKKSIKNFWVDECGIKLGTITESKQKIQALEYDRINTVVNGRMGVSLLTVRDGRCVCYWFEGSSNCFAPFLDGLGQSKVKVEDAASKPAGK